MNFAILTVSVLSLATSTATLLIMAKTAHELKAAKTQVESEVKDLKTKVNNNARVVKSALSAMEF